MYEVIDEPARARAWLAAAEGGKPDWDEILAGFDATVDWPGAAFWRELLATYPRAKAILTVRDPERWYDSTQQTIFRNAVRRPSKARDAVFRVLTLGEPGFRDFVAMTQAAIM